MGMQRQQAEPGASPFCQQRFQDEVTQWLQCRATSDERKRYTKYMGMLQEAAQEAASHQELKAQELLGSARSTGSSGTLSSRSKRTPRWSELPQATAPGLLETAAMRARQAAATRRGRLPAAAAAADADTRPASALPASWSHTATVAGSRRGALGSAQRPASAAAAQADGAEPGLRLPLEGLAPPGGADGGRVGVDAAAPAAGAAAEEAGDPMSATARVSARAAAIAAAPPAPKVNATNITTSLASYGLKDLYPDLWANTLPICRPEAALNKNFVSDWGESLQKGADETWSPFLASTYTQANAQVHKPTDEYKVRQQTALASWVSKQRTYCQGLLAPRTTDGVVALLARLPGPEKTELVELLRQLHAVVHPERVKPLSHELHCPQYSVEDTETTRLLKEQTKIKTMGFPRKVEVKGFRTRQQGAKPGELTAGDATTADAGGGAAEGAVGNAPPPPAPRRPRRAAATAGGAAPKAGDLVETLRSKCPLKWACSELYPATTAYAQAFGSHPTRTTQMHRVVFPEVNAGWGHVDEVRYPPGSGVYPIPQHFTTAPRVLHDRPSEEDMKTTNRLSYKPRDKASALRAIAEAHEQIDASRAARSKSYIPLSKAGIQARPQWQTTHAAEFRERPIDLTANRAMAEAVSAMFNGPTISFGRIQGMRQQGLTSLKKAGAQERAPLGGTDTATSPCCAGGVEVAA